MTTVSRHDEVLELLPWFVNGTLSRDEAAVVESHVSECLRCYAALQQERRLSGLVAGRSDADLAVGHGFDRLMRDIDRQPPVASAAQRSAPIPARRRRLAIAAAAGIAALAWVGYIGFVGPGLRGFTTLTAPAESARTRIDVVFEASMSDAEIGALLSGIDGAVVGGPTRLGRYTVELDRSLSDAELSRLLAALRGDARIRFAGPSFIAEER